MPSENDKDIEIGNKVENVVVANSDNVESASDTPAAATVGAAPTAIVAAAKPATEDSAVHADATTTNGNTVTTPATVQKEVTATAAAQEQLPPSQPKLETGGLQANIEPMQQSNAGKMDEDAALTNFKVLYVVTQLCGLTMIILVSCWVGIHFGGVGGTANPRLEFNWHPLFMTIGLLFLYGNSILVYRGFRNVRKKTLKWTHAGIHLTAFVLTVIALITVFDSHNLANPPVPNMYSLHSWLGMGAVIVFGLQYVAGFTAYLAPGWRQALKVAYMPLHIYFGLFGFVLAIASALMGITEKAIFAIPDYSSFSSAGVMGNCLGLVYVIFGALVVYLVTEGSYKRKPLPEDAVLLTAILVYRGFRNVRKKTLKWTHAGIHLTAFVLTVIALITVFDSHNLANPPVPNMYSLHSWLGMGAVIVFGLQYVAGFTAYLAPGWRQALKVAYMPLHIYFGLFGFVLAIASALMGITEKAIFAIPDYSSFSSAGVMGNCLGLVYVIFGALVVYLVTEGSYKRKPLPEDAVLLTGANE